jgi:hypothetical protein
MSIDGDDSRKQQQQQRRRRRDEIFALHRKVRKNKADGGNGGDGGDGGDGDIDAAGEIIITPYLLETTVVPAMKDLLQNEDLKREITIRSSLSDEEKKDNIGDGIDVDKDDDDDVQFTIAILDCLISFLTSNDNQSSSSSSSQRSATTNSLSFRAGNRSPSKSSSIKEIKTLFVTSGAYEMIMHLLRQILDDHCNQASSKSWQTTAKSDIGTDMDNIGIGIDFDHMDNGCDLKIESCLPSNQIPVKIMKLIALLANNSSDTIKNDHLLIHLNTIIHKSMMIYCPCSQIQGYGCWILYSLSNPLLQELIAAGSFSLLVQAMKCHPCSKKVQEYGNKALYNLLPLLVLCYNQNQINNSPPKSKSKSSSSSDSPPPAMKMNGMMKKSIEIDGKQLEDYESLLPSLSAIVLRGMEYHYPYQLSVQQYGLLVLMRLCQHDQEQYEIIVSEGGLTALLNIIKMTTTDTYSALSSMNTSDSDDDDDDNDDDDHSVHDQRSIKDKYESLAQMACQFLRDLSRPTNSSLDILRIIAVKGGIQTVLDLLDYYNANDESSQQGSSSVINIIDPAMACLRNLMVHEDNRTEVVTKSLSIDSAKKDGIIPIVLKIMNAHRYDAAIQAYGCDLLGRIASNEELGRIILIQTTINNNDNNNIGIGIGNGNGNGNGNNNEDNNNTVNNNKSSPTGSTAADAMKPRSRFWNSRNNKASSTSETTTTTTTTTKNNTPEDADADEEIINLSDQFNNSSSISNGSAIMTTSSSTTSMDSIDMNSTNTGNNDSIINNNIKEPKPKLTRNSNSDDDVDSFITIIRAMKTHRMHHGVQQRAIILLLALVVDKDNNNLNNNNNSMNSSSYLIQRLQEVYYDIQHQEEVAEEVPNNMSGNNRQQKENNNTTFISFLKTTSVTSKGLDRLQKLIKIVEQYECMKQKQQGIGIGIGIGGPTNTNTATATASSMVTNLFRGWGA